MAALDLPGALPLAGDGCSHLSALDTPPSATTETCAECGAGRVLRVCLHCGHVGCCDSHNGHASAHADAAGHPLIRAWKGGAFVYCYEHGYL